MSFCRPDGLLLDVKGAWPGRRLDVGIEKVWNCAQTLPLEREGMLIRRFASTTLVFFAVLSACSQDSEGPTTISKPEFRAVELARSSPEVQRLLRTHPGGTSDPLDVIDYDVHRDQIWQEADRDDNSFHWSRRPAACADEYYVDVTYPSETELKVPAPATPNVDADLNAENHMFLVDLRSGEARRVAWDADFAPEGPVAMPTPCMDGSQPR